MKGAMEDNVLEEVEELSFDDIQVVPRIDGIIILAKTMKFVKAVSKVVVKFPVFVTKLGRTDLKGCKTLEKANGIWEIVIAYLNEFRISCLFWSEDRYVDYRTLATMFTSSFNDAVMSMHNTETKNWWVQQLEPKSSQNSSAVKLVYPGDFEVFAEKFSSSLRRKLCPASGEPTINLCFKGMEMGQCAPLKDSLIRYGTIVNYDVQESIIHVAFDMEVEGASILWDRKALVERISTPNYEYFPMGFCGYANCYFHTSSEEQITGTPLVRLIKPYSAANKHASHEGAFRKGEIASTLVDASRGQNKAKINKELKRYGKQVDMLERLVDQFQNNFKSYGRLEIVLSTTTPAFNWQYQAFSVALDYVKSRNICCKEVMYCATNSQIYDRLSSYFVPIANTIRSQLDRYFQCETMEVQYDFSAEDFLNVSAAEAIACFLLYGSSVSTRENACHNNQLCKDLGLNISNFKHGLLANPRLAAETCEITDKICYSPRFHFTEFIEHATRTSNFSLCTQELRFGIYMSSSNEIVQYLIQSSLLEQKSKSKSMRFQSTHKLFGSRKNEVIVTSQEFIHWLFEEFIGGTRQLIGGHTGLLWVTKRFKEASDGGGNYEQWKLHLRNHLEDSLFSQVSFLNFVTPSKSFIVVPLSGTGTNNGAFTTLATMDNISFIRYVKMMVDIYRVQEEKNGSKVDKFLLQRIRFGMEKVLVYAKGLDFATLSQICILDVLKYSNNYTLNSNPPNPFV